MKKGKKKLFVNRFGEEWGPEPFDWKQDEGIGFPFDSGTMLAFALLFGGMILLHFLAR